MPDCRIKSGEQRDRYDPNTPEKQTENQPRIAPYSERDDARVREQFRAEHIRRHVESKSGKTASLFEYAKGKENKHTQGKGNLRRVDQPNKCRLGGPDYAAKKQADYDQDHDNSR